MNARLLHGASDLAEAGHPPGDEALDLANAGLRAADGLGHEARLRPADHAALKLWLRLLACTTQIETDIRRRLRERFGVSLSRFDYLAQLHRHAQGLRMRELSRRLMVTGGNVTALTDELATEGWVERHADPDDRRAWRVALTPEGRRQFERMAAEHETWVVELMSGLDTGSQQALHTLLGQLRLSLTPSLDARAAAHRPA